jgi:hypothetical protein
MPRSHRVVENNIWFFGEFFIKKRNQPSSGRAKPPFMDRGYAPGGSPFGNSLVLPDGTAMPASSGHWGSRQLRSEETDANSRKINASSIQF